MTPTTHLPVTYAVYRRLDLAANKSLQAGLTVAALVGFGVYGWLFTHARPAFGLLGSLRILPRHRGGTCPSLTTSPLVSPRLPCSLSAV